MVNGRGGRGFLLEQFQGDASSNCEKASSGEIEVRGRVEVFLGNREVGRERGETNTSIIGALLKRVEEQARGVRGFKIGGAGRKFENEGGTNGARRGEAKECENEKRVDSRW